MDREVASIEKLMEAPAEDWLELMNVEDMAAAPVNTLDKVIVDPQLQHRHMILDLEHNLGGKVRMVGNPIKMPDSIDDSDYTAPPTLGQHNDEVLLDLLGYSREKVDKLLEEGRAHLEELNEHLYKRL